MIVIGIVGLHGGSDMATHFFASFLEIMNKIHEIFRLSLFKESNLKSLYSGIFGCFYYKIMF